MPYGRNTLNHEKMTKRILLLILMQFYLWGMINAQIESGLNFMDGVPQSVGTNPSFHSDYGLTFSLPSVFNQFSFEGPVYDDFITTKDGKTVIDFGNFVDKLKERNGIYENLSINTAGFSFAATKKLRFSFSHALKFNAFFDYPKTLPQILGEGNAQFIGEHVDLGTDFQIFSYSEFAVGATYKLKKVTLGVSAKYLSGLGDISVKKNNLSVYTDDDIYQLTFNADYSVNSSSSFVFNDFNNYEFDFNKIGINDIFSKNGGIAFDIGATTRYNDTELSIGIIDIGKIKWTKNVNNYSSSGVFTFEGLDLKQALGGDSVTVSTAIDTLKEIFAVSESHDSYSTMLPTKIYLSLKQTINKKLSIGGGVFYERFRARNFPGFYLGANYRVGKALAVGGTYSLYKNSFDNIGLNFSTKFGPVQVFGVTDNVIAAFRPFKSKHFTFRVGMNLLFKEDKGRRKLRR